MRVQSAHVSATGRSEPRQMGQTAGHRRLAAIAIRADGRAVPVRLPSDVLVAILVKLELIVLGLLALIPSSRQEPGERRR
jgi:hypothetical protein